MKKIFLNPKFYLLLSITLIVGMIAPNLSGGNQASAASNTELGNYSNQGSNYITFETIQLDQLNTFELNHLKNSNLEQQYPDDTIIKPAAAQAVLVFIGGILAGYIIDGVLIRTTGMSGGEWVAKALTFKAKNPKCTKIFFAKKAGKPICHSGSRGKF